MRVPIPVVILLVLAVCGGVWWVNTRPSDVPPPRAAVPAPPPPVKPAVDLGDLTTPLTLQHYGELSPRGAAHLIELATALEGKGQFQRALLAWERVLDLTKPDARQAATAVASIQRLRPTLPDWNTNPAAAIPLTLRVSTGKNFAKTVTPVLEEVAHELERASSGIVKIQVSVSSGRGGGTQNPPLVALWFAGSAANTTEVRSFTVASPEALRASVLKAAWLLIRNQLSRATAYTPPAELAAGESPDAALSSRVTRLCWSEFAAGLNLPPKKPRK